MFNSTTKKRIQALGILFLIIGTFTTYFNLYQMNIKTNSNGSNKELDEKSYIFEIEYDDLKTADYSDNYTSVGGNINVSLHQSLVNTTRAGFSNLDNSNSFKEACPTDTTFSSSFINVTVQDIQAPDKTLIVEDDYTGGVPLFQFNNHYLSFIARGVGFIENITLRIYLVNTGDPSNLTISLFSSTYDSVDARIEPDANLGIIVANDEVNASKTNWYWHKVENINAQYNASNTYNDVFFLRIDNVGGSGINTDYASDTGGIDAVDESLVYRTDTETPEYLALPANTIDFPLIIDFYPLDNTPKPSDINLQINNTKVTDDPTNENFGYWINTNPYSSASGKLNFALSADWWDVSCNVSYAQINYTKTDLTAPSIFYIESSGKSINWNSTLGTINNFGVTFSAYRINFTVPASWENFTAFDATLDKTSDITLGPISNNYRELEISNANNGNNWYITADSVNLIENIQTSVNSILRDTVNFTNIVDFVANFSETISNGAINLSVYSPSSYLNHSYYNDAISTNSDIPLGNWDISDVSSRNIEYGSYIVQVHWNNGTAAGFLEKALTIVAVTELVLESPQDGQI
ncbi:MAG: hypothetical protein ACFE9N_02620, partial [Promethearchaeota archaeon]